jgi:hypothetical protein
MRFKKQTMKTQNTVRSSLKTVATLLVACTISVMPASTFASGSTNSGGGSGGSGGGGGSVQSSPLTSFKVSVGYYRGYGAIWTSYSVQSSSSLPIVRRTLTDLSTGQVVFENIYNYVSFVVDDDFLPNSRAYLVTIDVLDNSGAVLDSASAIVTTPPPKTQP